MDKKLKESVHTRCLSTESGQHTWVTALKPVQVYDGYRVRMRNFLVPQCVYCQKYDDASAKELNAGGSVFGDDKLSSSKVKE